MQIQEKKKHDMKSNQGYILVYYCGLDMKYSHKKLLYWKLDP
jgi:hypothetical protein